MVLFESVGIVSIPEGLPPLHEETVSVMVDCFLLHPNNQQILLIKPDRKQIPLMKNDKASEVLAWLPGCRAISGKTYEESAVDMLLDMYDARVGLDRIDYITDCSILWRSYYHREHKIYLVMLREDELRLTNESHWVDLAEAVKGSACPDAMAYAIGQLNLKLEEKEFVFRAN